MQKTFAKQKIQMMMAVLVNQVVNQIKLATVEHVEERQPGPMPVTKTHNSAGLQRNDPRRQCSEQSCPRRPCLFDHRQGTLDPFHDVRRRGVHRCRNPVSSIDQGWPYGYPASSCAEA